MPGSKIVKWDVPESNTRSFKSRPWLAKSVCRVVKLSKGDGTLDKASDDLEIRPSRRPVGTLQNGPPCQH